MAPAAGLLAWQHDCVDLLSAQLNVAIVGCVSLPANASAIDHAGYRWLDELTRPRSARRRTPREADTAGQRIALRTARNADRLDDDDIEWIRDRATDFVLAFDAHTVVAAHGTLARAGVWQFGEGGAAPGARPAPAVGTLARGDTRLTLALWAQTGAQAVPIAQGHTPAVLHSRKRSLARLYEIAPDLLRRAVADLRNPGPPTLSTPVENAEAHPPVGWSRFLTAMLRATLRRWFEKIWLRQRWDIGFIETREPIPNTRQIAAARWFAGPNAGFWADPCLVADVDGTVLLVEEYPDRTGKGRIARLHWRDGDIGRAPTVTTLLESDAHLSFPRSYVIDEARWLVPEMAAGGEQRAYRLDHDGQLCDASSMPVEGLVGIDPALFTHAERHWAFISPPGRRANYQLDLYIADDFLGPYRRHPASPVRIDPHGGRSAGPVIHDGKRLLRFGQVFGRHYGEAIDVFEITTLTDERYAERRVARIRPPASTAAGMHTIDFSADLTVIDRFRLEPVWRLMLERVTKSRAD